MNDHEYLKSRIDYNPETGEFRWKHRSDIARSAQWNGRYAGTVAGSKLNINIRGCKRTYYRINIGKEYLAHRLAWFIVYGREPDGDIDHIDGNPLNNAISNLRECTKSQNHANRAGSSTGTSRFKGVSLTKHGRWYAQLVVRGQHVLHKTFDCEESAARAYDLAAVEHCGEFARLNFPVEEN